MGMTSPEATHWLVEGLLAACLVALAGAALVGIWLLAHPPSALRLHAAASRWLSLRRSLRPLEVPVASERGFYRRHRAFGLIVVAGAIYALYRWALSFDRAALLRYLEAVVGWDAAWLVQTGETVFVLFHALLLPLGIVLVVRPSLLKGLEARSNRWLSTRRAGRPLDLPHGGVDRFAERHPRLTGAVVLIGAVYALTALTLALV